MSRPLRRRLGYFTSSRSWSFHGPRVRLEGEADFDGVMLMYYPGLEYFTELMQSTFFQGIVGGKQPGDTLAAPTGPLLSLL